jgi:hypothetical protein
MKYFKYYFTVVFILLNTICLSQVVSPKKNVKTKNGILINYLHEPYFLPITDTAFEKISNSRALGLKLGEIDLNNILDSISHKRNIVNYTPFWSKHLTLIIHGAGASMSKGLIQKAKIFRLPFGPACAMRLNFTNDLVKTEQVLSIASSASKCSYIFLYCNNEVYIKSSLIPSRSSIAGGRYWKRLTIIRSGW